MTGHLWSNILANTNQAKKRVRQVIKARSANFSKKNTMRTYIKKVRASISSDNAVGAQDAIKQAFPYIDKMVAKGIIHANTAARYKSRLNGQVKNLANKAD